MYSSRGTLATASLTAGSMAAGWTAMAVVTALLLMVVAARIVLRARARNARSLSSYEPTDDDTPDLGG